MARRRPFTDKETEYLLSLLRMDHRKKLRARSVFAARRSPQSELDKVDEKVTMNEGLQSKLEGMLR